MKPATAKTSAAGSGRGGRAPGPDGEALLATIDEGYATGLFGVPVEVLPAFRKELELPGDVAIACGITIGRPADDSEVSASSSRLTRRRRALEEVVHRERW
jgi:nitroreductase